MQIFEMTNIMINLFIAGRTALHYAVKCGQIHIGRYLVINGASPDMRDYQGMIYN